MFYLNTTLRNNKKWASKTNNERTENLDKLIHNIGNKIIKEHTLWCTTARNIYNIQKQTRLPVTRHTMDELTIHHEHVCAYNATCNDRLTKYYYREK